METMETCLTKSTEFLFILKPSSIIGAGIGVFATVYIPKGMTVFSGKFQPRKIKTKQVPSEFIKYCVFVDDEECLCPERFDRMEIGWYLNHSDQPNIAKNSTGSVTALRDIQAGEEILIDYNNLNEPEHLKEAYYKV